MTGLHWSINLDIISYYANKNNTRLMDFFLLFFYPHYMAAAAWINQHSTIIIVLKSSSFYNKLFSMTQLLEGMNKLEERRETPVWAFWWSVSNFSWFTFHQILSVSARISKYLGQKFKIWFHNIANLAKMGQTRLDHQSLKK